MFSLSIKNNKVSIFKNGILEVLKKGASRKSDLYITLPDDMIHDDTIIKEYVFNNINKNIMDNKYDKVLSDTLISLLLTDPFSNTVIYYDNTIIDSGNQPYTMINKVTPLEIVNTNGVMSINESHSGFYSATFCKSGTTPKIINYSNKAEMIDALQPERTYYSRSNDRSFLVRSKEKEV